MVASSKEAGTTPRTISVLDRARGAKLDPAQAVRKFDQCGWAGQLSPAGALPRGWSAVRNMLTNGKRVTAPMANRTAGPITRSDRERAVTATARSVATAGPRRARGRAGPWPARTQDPPDGR